MSARPLHHPNWSPPGYGPHRASNGTNGGVYGYDYHNHVCHGVILVGKLVGVMEMGGIECAGVWSGSTRQKVAWILH